MCNLNTASLEQIAALPGVDLEAAYDLRLWRPYLTWDQVIMVPGFDPDRVERLREAGAVIDIPH